MRQPHVQSNHALWLLSGPFREATGRRQLIEFTQWLWRIPRSHECLA
jgi:hypothetical protein